MKYARKLLRTAKDLIPVKGFCFDRPLVLFESDDWGRVGLRDQEGLEQLRAAGLALGERPYDFYTLETAEDLTALSAALRRHHDSSGRHPCLGMNFILSNPDFCKMSGEAFATLHFLPLVDGLPKGWQRPGLRDAYRQGIADGIFQPALHGSTHFCRSAVERNLANGGERAAALRTLWQAGTPYIHWRMPWIGYEYWDPEKDEDEQMLPGDVQQRLIGESVGAFAKMFSALPRSACAPGYRANDDTHHAWAQHGIRVAQNGLAGAPPHFDRFPILQVCRNVDFEPAVNAQFSVEACLSQAEACFARGIPAVVSVHAINFHSTVADFRTPTLLALERFLAVLESRHDDLLYLHDDDLCELVSKGVCRAPHQVVKANVIQKNFNRRRLAKGRDA